MKQTAVDWMFDQLWETPKDKLAWFKILMEAEEMYKEQIKDSNRDGVDMVVDNKNFITGEQYYKEKYETDSNTTSHSYGKK
jgi:Fic family protein